MAKRFGDKRLDEGTRTELLTRLEALLDRLCAQRRTMTYRDVADHLAVPGPHRIHKTTRLLELMLRRDVEAGRAPRAALVVSRVGAGRPAAGFFDRALRLGIFDGRSADDFHDDLLRQLHGGMVDDPP